MLAAAQVFSSTLGFLTASLKLAYRQQPLVDARRATAIIAAAKHPGAHDHLVAHKQATVAAIYSYQPNLTLVITQLRDHPFSSHMHPENALRSCSVAIFVSICYAIQPVFRVDTTSV